MAQIATVTLPALVISFNNNLFVDPDNTELVTGKVLYVPCRDVDFDNENMWAIPVKDAGIFTGYDFELKNGAYTSQPTYDSFTVFRIKDKFSQNEWIIYGSQADFFTSCATCCGSSTVPMPGVLSWGQHIAPCETLDLTDANGNPYMLFGLPSLTGSERYYPVGSYNGNGFVQASASGYSSIASLLSFLNANWTPFTWTASADGLTLTATAGTAGLQLCVSVIPFLASA